MEELKEVARKDTPRFELIASVSADKLKLFVEVIPKGTPAVSVQEFESLLQEFTSLDGADTTIIKEIVADINQGKVTKPRRIKKGIPPVDGKEGKYVLLVKPLSREKGAGDVKGREALTNLHLFDNIIVGQVIGRVYPPKPGKDGVDVLGNGIPSASAKEAKITLDEETIERLPPQEGESFERLVSKVEGYLDHRDGAVSIKEELLVDGDIDYRIGDIDFIGKVRIKGEVNPGFTISAKKGITAESRVRDARLVSAQGDIEIKGAALGGEFGKVIGTQKIAFTSAQDLVIVSVGSIEFKEHALRCSIRTHGALFGKAASLVGGETFTVCGAELKEIGNEAGLTTTVFVGSTAEVGAEFAELSGRIQKHDEAIAMVELHLGPFASNPKRVSTLSTDHRRKMELLLAKREQLSTSRRSLLGRKKELLEHGKTSKDAHITVGDVIHDGAVLKIGDGVLEVKESIKGACSFYLGEDGKISKQEPKPVTCQIEEEKV